MTVEKLLSDIEVKRKNLKRLEYLLAMDISKTLVYLVEDERLHEDVRELIEEAKERQLEELRNLEDKVKAVNKLLEN